MFNLSYLTFSDAAKYAGVAKNIVLGNGFKSDFAFSLADPIISPSWPYFLSLFFRLFGISDAVVMLASFVCLLLVLIFSYLLVKKLTNNKWLSFISTVLILFNKDMLTYAFSGGTELFLIFQIVAIFYLLSFKEKIKNYLSILLGIVMFLTRPQAIIYIFGAILFYCLFNYNFKKAIVIFMTTFVLGSVAFLIYSQQGIFAATQVLPGGSASDSLRGQTFNLNIIQVSKKVFYNLYNFYKLLPDIINPYIFVFLTLSAVLWSKDRLLNSFKVAALFCIFGTFLITALTIPFYRYIHPIVPLVYIIGVLTLYKLTENLNKIGVGLILAILCVGQTIGFLVLDSRFYKKTINEGKPPIYVLESRVLKDFTNPNDLIVTNLDTWGSWYGDRKTFWFPISPDMLIDSNFNPDVIYLTSYRMDDQNYYMGDKWREIFNNPVDQTVLPNYKFVAEYQFNPDDNHERENGRAVLLKRTD